MKTTFKNTLPFIPSPQGRGNSRRHPQGYLQNLLFNCLAISLSLFLHSCVSENIKDADDFSTYQKLMVEKGPQNRPDDKGLEALRPGLESRMPHLEVADGKSPGKIKKDLSLEDAVFHALSNSPEITVGSFDPSIAREEVTKAVSEFDVRLFEQFEYKKEDAPSDSILGNSQVNTRSVEMGLKQKYITGAEWSFAYSSTRTWNDYALRKFDTSYEPMITFQLKQPLLRDAWARANLSGVSIARLNYQIAFASFSQKTGNVLTDVISLYWTLFEARKDLEIQQGLLDRTVETFNKVEGRKDIDATVGYIKQAETFVNTRQALVFQAEKRLIDVQDEFVRLLSNWELSLLNDIEIVPVTRPALDITEFDQPEVLKQALLNNPEIVTAKLGAEVAKINYDLSSSQRMPRMDLVGSVNLQGLSDKRYLAQEMISGSDYTSYSAGLILEYPLGNREADAEFRRRKLEYSKTVSNLQNISDQVAVQVRERIRQAEESYKEIKVQQEAAESAKIHLQSIEDLETIREKLTPEFILTKLQAQETLAGAQRAEIKAVAGYNIALIRLAQATGTVLDMRYVKTALTAQH